MEQFLLELQWSTLAELKARAEKCSETGEDGSGDGEDEFNKIL